MTGGKTLTAGDGGGGNGGGSGDGDGDDGGGNGGGGNGGGEMGGDGGDGKKASTLRVMPEATASQETPCGLSLCPKGLNSAHHTQC